ncbi:hemerythrin domain-containing protein, partial [Parapusillimonas sp. SGNA-6]|nr:hemerythrin domain-containing protein [Parapusillimonas sp. SGNA-6]
MSTLSSRLLPSVTNMIRLDHTHVLSTFHQYKGAAPARVRKGLASTIFTALEIHAQLEEEIFYPAMGDIEGGDAIL